jgi:hypothetical protein
MAKTKTTTKKPVAKKATAKTKSKPATKTKTTAKQGVRQFLAKTKTTTRRPPNNPDMPQETIDNLNMKLNSIMGDLDEYSQHMRALDRRRLNGVGIKKLGFIERAYELALENPEFLPHYLTIERFGDDIHYFTDFRSLVDLTMQIREKLWNITMRSADIAYTNALEFYASVSDAAKRRVDAAETLHNELRGFFRHSRPTNTEPTEKQLLKDAKSLIRGKHDGEIIIENIKPKLSGGKRKVIDERFSDTAKFKETENGEITE